MTGPAPLLILACGLLYMGCSDGGGGGGTPPLAEQHPIDGQADFNELPQAQAATITLYDSLGGAGAAVKTVDVRYAFANDDRHVYLAVEWTDDTQHNAFDPINGLVDVDGIALQLDVDGDGQHDPGEDKRFVIAALVGSFCIDQHVTPTGDADDTTGDGQGKLSYDPVTDLYTAEFLVPIADDAAGQDGLLTGASRFNILIMDHAEIPLLTGNMGGLNGQGPVSATWPTLPLDPDARASHRVQPTLGGLITFVSAHDHVQGEIYTYDPATGVTTRVTNNTVHENNVSLSHDRTRIAFHGAPDKTDFANYEIYTINVNGTGLTQLTNNAILDGHPAWSLDDTRIVYASFRDNPRAHLVVMTDTGTELDDLTPMGFDDNDPEYLPDGRVVFKTDRFSTSPEVRIAVMNEDGTGVVRLTSVSGVSDHDPVGDPTSTCTVIERFPKGTDYSTDPEALLTPWQLIEVRNDGGGERTLLSDAWLNWLPVYSPAGQHLAYLKTVGGYTEVRLIDRNGKDFGRLVPDVTNLEYLDWK